ncbi:PREDICTED: uncharacterized protein LOC109183610 [Ipomoea nil]|uniref:uncharacterized protein LOC109183610 n=1 Tax=Ipomoea nil TaxID=35883 RepID=UPI0009019A5B|nr:PREDICTED: uncharacterized protein LOC109183610 [Ipomoea nil]
MATTEFQLSSISIHLPWLTAAMRGGEGPAVVVWSPRNGPARLVLDDGVVRRSRWRGALTNVRHHHLEFFYGVQSFSSAFDVQSSIGSGARFVAAAMRDGGGDDGARQWRPSLPRRASGSALDLEGVRVAAGMLRCRRVVNLPVFHLRLCMKKRRRRWRMVG